MNYAYFLLQVCISVVYCREHIDGFDRNNEEVEMVRKEISFFPFDSV